MARVNIPIAAIKNVVVSGNCTGCGACAAQFGIEMSYDKDGHFRPQPLSTHLVDHINTNDSEQVEASTFESWCPGSTVSAARPRGSRRDPIFGPYISVWKAWAANPDTRHSGSSGGVLTALAAWMLKEGIVNTAVSAKAAEEHPRQTCPVKNREPQALLATAGSRYAPSPMLAHSGVYDGSALVIAKPCEISSLRRIDHQLGHVRDGILMTFFCAGLPSQNATDSLISALGGDPDLATSVKYRGNGWPGSFKAQFSDGGEVDAPYEQSWGHALGPTMQWRCKVCPDGVGESGDITAADFWFADQAGNPIFDEKPGVSALIARTIKGDELVKRAIREGVIEALPASLNELRTIQKHQVERRTTVGGRLLGLRLAGAKAPTYRGFGLWRLMITHPIANLRSAAGAYVRAKRGKGPAT